MKVMKYKNTQRHLVIFIAWN